MTVAELGLRVEQARPDVHAVLPSRGPSSVKAALSLGISSLLLAAMCMSPYFTFGPRGPLTFELYDSLIPLPNLGVLFADIVGEVALAVGVVGFLTAAIAVASAFGRNVRKALLVASIATTALSWVLMGLLIHVVGSVGAVLDHAGAGAWLSLTLPPLLVAVNLRKPARG
jgi:hypothetical protein